MGCDSIATTISGMGNEPTTLGPEDLKGHCFLTQNQVRSFFSRFGGIYSRNLEDFKALSDDRLPPNIFAVYSEKPSGEIYVTFSTENLRDKFIQQRCLALHGKPHVANDAEGPIASLTIYDAPYELPDATIIHRLRPYCEVLWYHRSTFRVHNRVFNSLRHFRVRVLNSIPSYLHFSHSFAS